MNAHQASVPEVAAATLSLATAHLNAINRLPGPRPWTISFSYGRALQDRALEGWHGRDENVHTGQQAFYHQARCNSAASLGTFTDDMEMTESVHGTNVR